MLVLVLQKVLMVSRAFQRLYSCCVCKQIYTCVPTALFLKVFSEHLPPVNSNAHAGVHEFCNIRIELLLTFLYQSLLNCCKGWQPSTLQGFCLTDQDPIADWVT